MGWDWMWGCGLDSPGPAWVRWWGLVNTVLFNSKAGIQRSIGTMRQEWWSCGSVSAPYYEAIWSSGDISPHVVWSMSVHSRVFILCNQERYINEIYFILSYISNHRRILVLGRKRSQIRYTTLLNWQCVCVCVCVSARYIQLGSNINTLILSVFLTVT